MSTILVVDDEKNIRRALRMVLEGEGYNVLDAETAEIGLEVLMSEDVDLVILDIRLPEMSGLELLAKVRAMAGFENVPILMVSGHASSSEAVQAVQSGATDFFEKPLDRDKVLVRIRNALKTWTLHKQLDRMRADAAGAEEIVGESDVIKALLTKIEKVAPTTGRVLITGESGTGKELIARAVHRMSKRSDAPFIKVNCAAIPSELIESELFGYERGAFTGADKRKKGMFELANNGTLFLDEIGDMSASAQAKVLRALQNGEVTRVGASEVISVDVRVIAATNKDLQVEVEEGRFREDLYFRLNVLPIESPPLRDRTGDVPLLAKAFFREYATSSGTTEKPVDADVFDALAARRWPGNVRELRNVIERMAILSDERITLDDIPVDGRPIPDGAVSAFPSVGDLTLKEYRELAEKEYIKDALEKADWNVSQAARDLGVERTNLHKKMKSHGIERD